MIEKIHAFKVGDKVFGTVAEAQNHELTEMLKNPEIPVDVTRLAVNAILKDKEKVMSILTMGPHSRPKARKANGGTKPGSGRKAKPSVGLTNEGTQEQPLLT